MMMMMMMIMTTFSSVFKKLFLAHFKLDVSFLWQRYYFQKIWLCHTQQHIGP